MPANPNYDTWVTQQLILAERENAFNRYVSNFVLTGFALTQGSGLTLLIGTPSSTSYAFIDGYEVTLNNQTSITLTDNATNYIWLYFTKNADPIAGTASINIFVTSNLTNIPPATDSLQLGIVVSTGGLFSITTNANNFTLAGNTTATGNIIPSPDATQNLGALTTRWQNLFLSGYMLGQFSAVQQPNPLIALTSSLTRQLNTNQGSGGTTEVVLPLAAAGLEYTFYVQTGQNMQIGASDSNTIRLAGTVTMPGGYIYSNVVGSSVRLVAINSIEWVAVSIVGTWIFPDDVSIENIEFPDMIDDFDEMLLWTDDMLTQAQNNPGPTMM